MNIKGQNKRYIHKPSKGVQKMTINKAIKIAMIQEEINQKELAQLSGVSETTISHTLSDKTSPNTKTLSRLGKAMNMSYSDLIKLGE